MDIDIDLTPRIPPSEWVNIHSKSSLPYGIIVFNNNSIRDCTVETKSRTLRVMFNTYSYGVAIPCVFVPEKTTLEELRGMCINKIMYGMVSKRPIRCIVYDIEWDEEETVLVKDLIEDRPLGLKVKVALA